MSKAWTAGCILECDSQITPRSWSKTQNSVLLQARGLLLDVHSRLLHSLAASAVPGALARPRHAHRLDSPTGGLLLVGKTHAAVAALCSMFVDRWA